MKTGQIEQETQDTSRQACYSAFTVCNDINY